jgi:hypothetical protein
VEDRLTVLADFLLEIAVHQRAMKDLIWQSGYSNQKYEEALTDARAKLGALPSVQAFRKQAGSTQLEPLLADVKTSLADPFGG